MTVGLRSGGAFSGWLVFPEGCSDEARGEPVKPDDWKPPDFRSLIKIARTEQGSQKCLVSWNMRKESQWPSP